jgi:nitroreductase
MTAAPPSFEAFDALMRKRRSVRGFKPDAVPQEVIAQVFTTAQLAPSNCNAQAWLTHIVSGGAAEQMRAMLHDLATREVPIAPDVKPVPDYTGVFRKRQIGAAVALFQATGVARDDIPARQASMLRNFSFFDAPHAAFIFIPDWGGLREAADLGQYTQSIMLALSAHGLASCPQGALGYYAPQIREALGVAPDYRLMFGISFGYEDDTHPTRNAITDRAALADAVVFHS